MMSRKIEIVAGDDHGQGFINAWKAAERSDANQEARQILAFAELETLFKVLSTSRLRLLRVLHQAGHISIRDLSRRLDRDYSGVHASVTMMKRVGLIEDDAEGLIFTPFDQIMAEMNLAAA
jgi:predicted transcriptional regulator